MLDMLGNKIHEKSILYWHPDPNHGVICQVAHVTDGGISMGDSNELTPPMLVIQVMIPVTNTPRGKEPMLTQFVCAVNPTAEAAIEKMMAGQRKQ